MTWCVLSGECEWWADEGIRDVGRARFHQARGTELSSAQTPLGTIEFSRIAFQVRRGSRLVQMHVAGSDGTPDLEAWADEVSSVLFDARPLEAGARGVHASLSHGWLWSMLHPAPLEGVVPKPWFSQIRIEGHLLEPPTCSVFPAFVSLAADFYEATYDADLDVLTAWTAYIDGAAAHRLRISLSQLADASA